MLHSIAGKFLKSSYFWLLQKPGLLQCPSAAGGYLVTRPERRTLAAERQDAPILEGISIHPPERRRTGVTAPPAPPPSEVLEVEPLIPLTQPLPREDVD